MEQTISVFVTLILVGEDVDMGKDAAAVIIFAVELMTDVVELTGDVVKADAATGIQNISNLLL
jgi:hypothetical protein